jgi:PAT family beta-lactamase induction signal transducer AmpG
VTAPARLLGAIVVLGFASGLPYTMVGDMLTTWAGKAGWADTDLVLLGWLTLPFQLKVLWAPLIDRFAPPLLGRRRGWLAIAQLLAAGGLALLAGTSPVAPGPWIALAALVAVAAATFDLAANAYAIEAAPRAQHSAAAGAQVWGWRAGFLACATVVPLLADAHGWATAFLAAAAVQTCAALAILLAPEPPAAAAPASLRAAVLEPLRGLLAHRGVGILLLFVLLYGSSDGMAKTFTGAFLAKQYTLQELSLRGAGGLVGAGIGALLGGWLALRWGLTPCLWLFGALAALSNLLYVGIAQGLLPGPGGLLTVVLIDNACGTMAAAAFVAFLMSRCQAGMAATQYALLATIGLASPHIWRLFAGLPANIGWSQTYLLSVAVALPGLLLIPLATRPPASSLQPQATA